VPVTGHTKLESQPEDLPAPGRPARANLKMMIVHRDGTVTADGHQLARSRGLLLRGTAGGGMPVPVVNLTRSLLRVLLS
jgi:hypothetical protein